MWVRTLYASMCVHMVVPNGPFVRPTFSTRTSRASASMFSFGTSSWFHMNRIRIDRFSYQNHAYDSFLYVSILRCRFQKAKQSVGSWCGVRLKKRHLRQIEAIMPELYVFEENSQGGLFVALPKDVFAQLGRGRRAGDRVFTSSSSGSTDDGGRVDALASRLDAFKRIVREYDRSGKSLPTPAPPSMSTSCREKKSLPTSKRSRSSSSASTGDEKEGDDDSFVFDPSAVPKSLRGLPPALLKKMMRKESRKKRRVEKKVMESKYVGLHALPRLCRSVRGYLVTEKKTAEFLDVLTANLVASRHHNGAQTTDAQMERQLVLLATHCDDWCEIDPPLAKSSKLRREEEEEENDETRIGRPVFRLKPNCDYERTRAKLAEKIRNASAASAASSSSSS